MNSKFYLHLLGIWKRGNFLFGIALCLLRATELSQAPQKWQCIFVLEIGGTPINYAWLNSPTIVLCFLDSLEVQFMLFVSACLLKYYFLRARLHEPEVNSNRFEISIRGEISLWCKVTSLSVFTWPQAKWNSLRCKLGYHQDSSLSHSKV